MYDPVLARALGFCVFLSLIAVMVVKADDAAQAPAPRADVVAQATIHQNMERSLLSRP